MCKKERVWVHAKERVLEREKKKDTLYVFLSVYEFVFVSVYDFVCVNVHERECTVESV